MYVVFDKSKQKCPIKIWLPENEIEVECLGQAQKLAQLPFVRNWIALMPDTHVGMGMPIGGVITTKDVIIPNAVGSDIGCGMAYVQTDILASSLLETMTDSGSILQCLVGDILRNVPVGFSKHKENQPSTVLDEAIENLDRYDFAPNLRDEIKNAYRQVGTLGGGNHFIEIQQDDEGYVGIMIHSGSRALGNKVCNFFQKEAKKLNEKWFSELPDNTRLSFLPVDTDAGKAYISYMNLCLDFAHENRDKMMESVQIATTKLCEKHLDKSPEYTGYLNRHHNYAALEHHYGENVWVHRKGAIRARKGEIGIVPGAMGSFSYIVEGLGNPMSFDSCSHGAGRLMSRTKAKETFTVDEVMTDINASNMVLGKRSKKDVAEEYRLSYKNIEDVINNEKDLVKPIKKLFTLGVVKG